MFRFGACPAARFSHTLRSTNHFRTIHIIPPSLVQLGSRRPEKMPAVEVLENLDQFRKVIGSEADSSGAVAIIDFWATWCGPCRFISPIFKDLAEKETSGLVKFYSVDVDAASEIAAQCKISAMPTFIAYRNGKEIRSLKGADPAKLTALVQECASPV